MHEEIDIHQPPAPRPVRVAAVPAGHPYVRSVTDARHVHLLPDPPVPGAPRAQWWPPQVLAGDWTARHADEYDLVHLHFGLESFSPETVARAIHAAQRRGRPVVYTVHDLENPQLIDQRAHLEILDVVVPAVDRLITLTPGAAADVRARWGRECTVIAHPTLDESAPWEVSGGDGSASTTVRAGVHLRDLRPNIDAIGAIDDLVSATAELADAGVEARVTVRMNERVRDEGEAARVVAAAGIDGRVRVERGARLDDAALDRWLAGLDVFVLPYRHGTHSGWVELCHDRGVAVVGTAVGHLGEQHPDDFVAYRSGDGAGLAAALVRAAHLRVHGDELAIRRRRRLEERSRARAAHAEVYAGALRERAGR
jgi:glycosyltransferase involved in cell wall biosynthesis